MHVSATTREAVLLKGRERILHGLSITDRSLNVSVAEEAIECFTFLMCLAIQLKLKSVEGIALWEKKSKVQETKSIPFKYPWSYTKSKVFQLCKIDTSLGTVSLVWLQKKLPCAAFTLAPFRPSCSLRSVPRQIVFPSLASSWLIGSILKHRKLLWGMGLFPPWRCRISMCTS